MKTVLGVAGRIFSLHRRGCLGLANVIRRYAVASKEGIAISEHFGHARRFYIYELQDAGWQLAELREVAHYCHGQQSDQSAMQQILVSLADCEAVFVAKIGDGPAQKLAAIGVAAVAQYAWEPIEPSLLAYGRATGAERMTRLLADWLVRTPLSASDIDCATAVMLKILDGKCKMDAAEKQVMRALYHAVKHRPGLLLGNDTHALIATSGRDPGDAADDAACMRLYAQRVLAETRISRPVMKAFKAMIRDTGLLRLAADVAADA